MGMIERYRKDLSEIIDEQDGVLETTNREVLRYIALVDFAEKCIVKEKKKENPDKEYINNYTKEKEENMKKGRESKIRFNTQQLSYDTICGDLLRKIKECEKIESKNKAITKRSKKLRAENKELKGMAITKYLNKAKKRVKDTEEINAGLGKEVSDLLAENTRLKEKIERMKKDAKNKKRTN